MSYLYNAVKETVKEIFSSPSKSDSPNPMPPPGKGEGYRGTGYRRHSLNPFSKDRGHSYGPSGADYESNSQKRKNYSSASHNESVGRRDSVKQSPRTDFTHATGSPARNDRPREQSSIPKGKVYREEGRSYADVTQGDALHSSTTESSARNGTSGQTRRPPPSEPARSAEEESGLDGTHSNVDDTEGVQQAGTRRSESAHSQPTSLSSAPADPAQVASSPRSANHPESPNTQSSRNDHARGHDNALKRRCKELEYQLAEQERTRAEENGKLRNELERMQRESQRILRRQEQQTDALRREAQQQISLLNNQCAQHAGEAERLKVALQAAHTLSETRAKELSSAKAFLAVADDSSGADVVKLVNSLNDQVLQFAAQFIDMADVRDVERDIAVDEAGPQISDAKEHLRGLFGDKVDELFNLRIDQLEYASQCALQAILLFWCMKVVHTWSWTSEVDSALKGIYNGIQRSISDPALQTISTRWRALTRAQSRADWDVVESQIIECATNDAMCLLILVRGVHPLSAEEQAQRGKWTYDKISDILKLAFQISKVIGEGITSADYDLISPLPAELFDVNSMVDDNEVEEQSESPVQIICTCQLGLRQIQPGAPGRYQILTKAKVFLPSALSQF